MGPVFRGSIAPVLLLVAAMSVFSIRCILICPLGWVVVLFTLRPVRLVSIRALSAVVGALGLGAVALAARTGEHLACTVVPTLCAALRLSARNSHGVFWHTCRVGTEKVRDTTWPVRVATAEPVSQTQSWAGCCSSSRSWPLQLHAKLATAVATDTQAVQAHRDCGGLCVSPVSRSSCCDGVALGCGGGVQQWQALCAGINSLTGCRHGSSLLCCFRPLLILLQRGSRLC